MQRSIVPVLLSVLLSVFVVTPSTVVLGQEEERVTFVSSPDFFNFDVPNPMPEWEDAIDWYLTQVKAEDPDYFLVAGDLVDGRWHNMEESVEHMGLVYYEDWKRRMDEHDLNPMPAIGDHEMGDDPWPDDKAKLAPTFKETFRRHFDLPGEQYQGDEAVAYYVREGNVLFLTVDEYEYRDGDIHTTVSNGQLEWVETVLDEQGPKVDFIVVQGHNPVFGNPEATSSSQLMVDGGRDSEFWQVMKEAGVDLYLCGEFHALTTNKADGIWQVVHGTSWGRKGHIQSYLVGKSSPDRLEVSIHTFPFDVKGEQIWNMNKGASGPYDVVRIPKSTRQNKPDTAGTITIKKDGDGEKQVNRTGLFDK